MPDEIHFQRSGYESRVDVRADEIESFVAMVLDTIDVGAARTNPAQWDLVCRFFAGCARAAKAQGNTPRGGGSRIAEYLADNFPTTAEPTSDGFFEFMDWLANPAVYRPKSLQSALRQLHG